jgi:putative SOS response-associated peptidase YedK
LDEDVTTGSLNKAANSAVMFAGRFHVEVPALEPRYNVAPTQPAAVVRAKPGGREVALLRWGLIPPWATDMGIGNHLLNARAETIGADKPTFRSAFR